MDGFVHLERMEHLSLIPLLDIGNGLRGSGIGRELGRPRGIRINGLASGAEAFSFLDIILPLHLGLQDKYLLF